MEKMLKELKKGELFTMKPIEDAKASQVYERCEYDRSERKFYCERPWYDAVGNGRYIKGTTKVYTEFSF